MKPIKFPKASFGFLLFLIAGCSIIPIFGPYDPAYMDLSRCSMPPSGLHLFGSDAMGRDIFSMIWYGGRISLSIGVIAAVVSAAIAFLYGSISSSSTHMIDIALMKFVELLLSLPSILLVIFLQAIIGKATPISIGVVIGLTSWMQMAKVVRAEVREIRTQDYLLASASIGGGFFHIFRYHLLPNIIPIVQFMIVANFGQAIAAEAAISFLGLGLPMEVISWGSMLSLADRALLSNEWWIILVPGIFLIGTVFSITMLGNYIEDQKYRRISKL